MMINLNLIRVWGLWLCSRVLEGRHTSTATKMMSRFYILGNCVQSMVLLSLVILGRDLAIPDQLLHNDFMGQVRHRYLFGILSIP